jgi:hypothetical protein
MEPLYPALFFPASSPSSTSDGKKTTKDQLRIERAGREQLHRHDSSRKGRAGGRRGVAGVHASGHAILLTTSVYSHVAVDDDGELGNLFDFRRSG